LRDMAFAPRGYNARKGAMVPGILHARRRAGRIGQQWRSHRAHAKRAMAISLTGKTLETRAKACPYRKTEVPQKAWLCTDGGLFARMCMRSPSGRTGVLVSLMQGGPLRGG